MESVTIYLRTALFAYDKGGVEAHVPRGAMVIEGEITDRPAGCLSIRVATLRDGAGRPVLEGSSRTLQVPLSKIDHLEVHEQ